MGVFEIQIGDSSGGSDKVASRARVDMVAGILTLGADEVSLAAASARAYALRSVVRFSGVYLK